MTRRVDIAVIGAGAAGLMAATHAGRAGRGLCVVAVDGARKLGAKILVSGGGRCNVTHDVVDERFFAGGSIRAIRKVLKRYDVADVVRFFGERGVTFVREENGKLFPAAQRARTVLDALLGAAAEAGVEIRHPFRVETLRARDGVLELSGPAGRLEARRVILATGGRSVPQTGSDGHGYELARSLGHTLTEAVVPALVPLCLPEGHPLLELRGIATPVLLEVRSGKGRRVAAIDGALLCTHFGVSGPAVLDISRHWILASRDDPHARLTVRWLPAMEEASLDEQLRALGSTTVGTWLRQHLPARLVATLLTAAGVPGDPAGHALRREDRRALVGTLLAMDLPVVGPRGWAYAEVTAGGVPLTEVRLETMGSRVAEGLHLCGEVLDVDGQIGGYNFQWAWSSGYVAGLSAAHALTGAPGHAPEGDGPARA